MVRESRKGKYAEYKIEILNFLDRFFKYPYSSLELSEEEIKAIEEAGMIASKTNTFRRGSEYCTDLSIIAHGLDIPKSSTHDTLTKLIGQGFVKKVNQTEPLDLYVKGIYGDGYRITMKGHIHLNNKR
ncbi:MAG: hypothetical protein OEQ94_09905 [Nitrosopumilus sp.]|nr:hypothetical protein [Nitrosopumilus sp.]MDH3823207.1 hypothetical protein [Nitrosopumilus sp.]